LRHSDVITVSLNRQLTLILVLEELTLILTRTVTRINKTEQKAVQKGAKRSKAMQWRKLNLSPHQTDNSTRET